MLFRKQTLDGIADGSVRFAFRRWKRPMAKVGGRVRTVAGVVQIGDVEIVERPGLTERDARLAGFPSLAALLEMLGPDDGNPVYRIGLDGIEPDERVALRDQDTVTDAEWHEIAARLARWDAASPGHFVSILRSIEASPETAAVQLAEQLGVEKLKFKQDVRKLKELGLTESLDIGYRLSPRGKAVLQKIREHQF